MYKKNGNREQSSGPLLKSEKLPADEHCSARQSGPSLSEYGISIPHKHSLIIAISCKMREL
jgi:hypothetical protein